nr:hypothetical protein CFP56_77605 [Quercus suber]
MFYAAATATKQTVGDNVRRAVEFDPLNMAANGSTYVIHDQLECRSATGGRTGGVASHTKLSTGNTRTRVIRPRLGGAAPASAKTLSASSLDDFSPQDAMPGDRGCRRGCHVFGPDLALSHVAASRGHSYH